MSGGYKIIPKSQWDSIDNCSPIKYIDIDGKISRAVYMKRVYVKEGRRFYQFETQIGGKPGDQGYYSWPVEFKNIKSIYRMPDVIQDTEINEIKRKISLADSRIDELYSRLDKIDEKFAKYSRGLGEIAEEIKKMRRILGGKYAE